MIDMYMARPPISRVVFVFVVVRRFPACVRDGSAGERSDGEPADDAGSNGSSAAASFRFGGG